jgi:hypothetical protein
LVEPASEKIIPYILEIPVVSSNHPIFVHRHNADGTIVSFCRKCFVTVASSHRESELERAESNHQCDPYRLESLLGILDSAQDRGTNA